MIENDKCEWFSEDEESHPKKIDNVPPDGGWGWLVLFGCTLINFLLPGTIKSFGVLFVEFLEKFESSEIAASMIPALCYFLYCSLGPLSNYLSSKYSYRTVALLGGAFASLGLITSFFASSLLYLCMTYGLLFGTGTGLAFPPGIFLVTSYFQKYRGLVNGIATSGSAAGSMILPPLLRYLLENYGVNGAVLIMGAITMNVWVGALLYHPVSWYMKQIPIPRNTEHSKMILPIMQSPEDESSSSFQQDHDAVETIKRSTNPKSAMINDKVETVLFYDSGMKKVNLARSMSPRLNECHSPLRRHPSYVSVTSFKSSKYNLNSNSCVSRLQPLEYASQLTLKSISESLAPRKASGQKKPSQLVELLRTPVFVTILLSSAMTAIGHTNFIIFLPAYAISLKYDKTSSSLLLSVVAFFDLIGRLGGSCISDLLPFSRKYYFMVGITVSGVSLILVPLAKTYFTLCLTCALFGLSSGTFNGVFVVTIVELLGEDKLASSYTASLFVNGILQLIGPPICGLLYYSCKSFAVIIGGLGVMVTLGGGIWILPLILTMEKSEQKNCVVKQARTVATK